MASSRSPFGPGLLRFLRELERNNDRAWFAANRERYEAEVREPALAFIRVMEPQLEKISPHFVASDRKVGGALMRIHRDVRFSKSKQPYKTNLGIQFRHESGKDVHAPGLYFHVDPREVFLAVGMWHPDSRALGAVRTAIDDDPAGWKRVRDGKTFRRFWELRGDSLKRPPRGYTADHPMLEDIKRKDHIAVCTLGKRDITSPGFPAWTARSYGQAQTYLRWLTEALELPF